LRWRRPFSFSIGGGDKKGAEKIIEVDTFK
jgi:hypothetical protein